MFSSRENLDPNPANTTTGGDPMADSNAALPRDLKQIEDLHRFIDHTILHPTAQVVDIERLCAEAIKYDFHSVCVNGVWVPRCVDLLQGSNTSVCAVVGFPLGAVPTSVKLVEAKLYLAQGAREIDMVINLGKLLADDRRYVLDDIRELADLCKANSAILKVIIETCYLSNANDALAYKWKSLACDLAAQAGAHFVKTCTGFAKEDKIGATVEDVALMRHVVGESLGVKASGQIRDLNKALALIGAGASRIGASASVSIMQELSRANTTNA